MSVPDDADISAHGLIGDQRTAALVAADGTIDWCCMPQFDGTIVFGALLDNARGGHWSLGPQDGVQGTQRYIGDSAVLETRWERPECDLQLLDAMVPGAPAAPAAPGRHPLPTIVRRLRCNRGVARCALHLVPRLNFVRCAQVHPGGPAGAGSAPADASLWTSSRDLTEAAVASGVCRFTLKEGEEFWSVFSWGADAMDWSVQRTQAAFEEAEASWRHWARLHPWLGPERASVLASQRVIRLLSVSGTGSQVAAPTTSLPERIGGDRNYDYRFAWVRDSSLALATLAVFGDLEAAERYMDWLAARPAGKQMPLQVFYRINGGTDASEQELPEIAGYRRSRPVRVGNHAADQLQLDSLGYLADCTHIYLQQGGTWKPSYSRLLNELADFTAANWHRADHGIWELDEPRHYVSSKVMAWVVVDRAVRVREHLGEPVPPHWRQACGAIHAEVMERGWSNARRSFRQHYDADDLDASALLASMMDFLPGDHPRIIATIEAIQANLQREGFVWRFHPASLGHPEMPLNGLEASFVPCTFWLASALARAGRPDEARELLEDVESSFSSPGLLAEEFDPGSQQALGNYPLLFSHAEHLRAVMDLAKASPLGMAGMMAGKAAGALKRAIQPH